MIFLTPFRANIARLSPTSGDSDKEQYSTYLLGTPIDIQPASAQVTAISEGRFGQVFTGFTTVSGIQIGDRVTVSGYTDVYKVMGINNWNRPPMPHIELVLFRGDN